MKEKNWGFIDISICKIKELFVPFLCLLVNLKFLEQTKDVKELS